MLTIFVAIAIIAATTTCDVGFPDTINAIRIEDPTNFVRIDLPSFLFALSREFSGRTHHEKSQALQVAAIVINNSTFGTVLDLQGLYQNGQLEVINKSELIAMVEVSIREVVTKKDFNYVMELFELLLEEGETYDGEKHINHDKIVAAFKVLKEDPDSQAWLSDYLDEFKIAFLDDKSKWPHGRIERIAIIQLITMLVEYHFSLRHKLRELQSSSALAEMLPTNDASSSSPVVSDFQLANFFEQFIKPLRNKLSTNSSLISALNDEPLNFTNFFSHVSGQWNLCLKELQPLLQHQDFGLDIDELRFSPSHYPFNLYGWTQRNRMLTTLKKLVGWCAMHQKHRILPAYFEQNTSIVNFCHNSAETTNFQMLKMRLNILSEHLSTHLIIIENFLSLQESGGRPTSPHLNFGIVDENEYEGRIPLNEDDCGLLIEMTNKLRILDKRAIKTIHPFFKIDAEKPQSVDIQISQVIRDLTGTTCWLVRKKLAQVFNQLTYNIGIVYLHLDALTVDDKLSAQSSNAAIPNEVIPKSPKQSNSPNNNESLEPLEKYFNKVEVNHGYTDKVEMINLIKAEIEASYEILVEQLNAFLIRYGRNYEINLMEWGFGRERGKNPKTNNFLVLAKGKTLSTPSRPRHKIEKGKQTLEDVSKTKGSQIYLIKNIKRIDIAIEPRVPINAQIEFIRFYKAVCRNLMQEHHCQSNCGVNGVKHFYGQKNDDFARQMLALVFQDLFPAEHFARINMEKICESHNQEEYKRLNSLWEFFNPPEFINQLSQKIHREPNSQEIGPYTLVNLVHMASEIANEWNSLRTKLADYLKRCTDPKTKEVLTLLNNFKLLETTSAGSLGSPSLVIKIKNKRTDKVEHRINLYGLTKLQGFVSRVEEMLELRETGSSGRWKDEDCRKKVEVFVEMLNFLKQRIMIVLFAHEKSQPNLIDDNWQFQNWMLHGLYNEPFSRDECKITALIGKQRIKTFKLHSLPAYNSLFNTLTQTIEELYEAKMPIFQILRQKAIQRQCIQLGRASELAECSSFKTLAANLRTLMHTSSQTTSTSRSLKSDLELMLHSFFDHILFSCKNREAIEQILEEDDDLTKWEFLEAKQELVYYIIRVVYIEYAFAHLEVRSK